MTVPRHEIYRPDQIGVYHCVSRCVRRAFLCGNDNYSGKSFEHRREWVRERLAFLLSVFSIEVIAYAIMMNHLHTLIRNRPDLAASWSAEEVARRWRTLFPCRCENGSPTEPSEDEIKAITADPALIESYRERLSNMSWFNRCLCEHIARRANEEDECKGRFWEGRFKSQQVHDICGILACGIYIDLNPIRAKVAKTPEESEFTSIRDRIENYQGKRLTNSIPLISIENATNYQISTEQYFSLVDATGRIIRDGAQGVIPSHLQNILVRIKIKPNSWLRTATQVGRRFKRAVGSIESLRVAAAAAGKSWFHGISDARETFIS